MITFSEIETTTKRASKAAGFSWGVAEEIGKSIRSLELFGLPGIINLNHYPLIQLPHLSFLGYQTHQRKSLLKVYTILSSLALKKNSYFL